MPNLISVIIPAYNAEQFIHLALESVLSQSHPPHEIIVIDDGSTDNTRKVLTNFKGKVRCLYQQNRGPSAARNAGIRVAEGDLICFLDADDLWVSNKLASQHAYMMAHPEIAMVFSDHEEFNEEGMGLVSYLGIKQKAFGVFPIEAGPIENAFEKLVVENFISTPTVMVRKACLEKTGGFDEEIWSVEDRDLWLRISAVFPIACIPKIFCKRRFHQGNISRQKELTFQGRIRVLEKNRKLFPHLVLDGVWRRELAAHYLGLGFLLLQKGRKWEAFQAGIKTLSYGLEGIAERGCPVGIPAIFKGCGLLGATILGWPMSRFLWKPIKKNFW
ncbi:MAG: glycosyltransferase family 2 protein [Nitrospira sp.]|nr:glycosyltransferase family 2 protein [Nitrospira sp.]